MSEDNPPAPRWSHTKPTDPAKRIGVYQSLEDVPRTRQLEHQAKKADYGDLWSAWIDYRIKTENITDRTEQRLERVGRYWKEFMTSQDRHHAFPDPKHVEEFFSGLLDRMGMGQAFNPYWTHVEAFFWHLQERTNYPHLYHPPLMAAVNHPTAGRVFAYKTTRS